MLEVNGKMLARGVRVGLETTWELAKIVVPTALVVTILKASGLLDVITDFFAPYMGFFGLSGQAAIALFSGYLVNLYAAAGSVVALSLPPREVAILAAMLTFCHSLVVELPISKKAGNPLSYIFLVRLGGSLVIGALLGLILS